MTKKEAAKELGVSERAINRYVRGGKLTVDYRKNSQNSYEGVYKPYEVATLKEQFEKSPPLKLRPVKTLGRPKKAEALTRPDSDKELASSAVNALVKLAESAINTGGKVALESKLTLTLNDAVEFCSGYSRGYLLESIKAGKLKAIKRRGWVIKRADLDDWVKKG